MNIFANNFFLRQDAVHLSRFIRRIAFYEQELESAHHPRLDLLNGIMEFRPI